MQRETPVSTQAIVWNLAAETEVVIGTPEAASPAFYPQADLLAVVDRSDDGLDIFIADASTGELLSQVTASSETESSLVVSPLESTDIAVWLLP